ncbi:MAG: cache domain-containing protein [Desulfotalea sp.]
MISKNNSIMKSSLAFAPVKVGLIIVIILYCATGGYWCYDEYRKYNINLQYVKENFINNQKVLVSKEVEGVFASIKSSERDATNKIKRDLRDKVGIAYILISHFFSLNPQTNEGKLTEDIVETIRTIRWQAGYRSYFIIDEQVDGFVLKPKDPELENKKLDDFPQYKQLVKEYKINLATRNAGYIRHKFNGYEELTFMRRFEPYNWIIGTTLQVADIKKSAQRDVLSLIKEKNIHDKESIQCFSKNGKTLLKHNLYQIDGEDRFNDITDVKILGEIKKITETALKSGYIFTEKSDLSGNKSIELSYVSYYAPWDWVIVSTANLKSLDTIINKEKEQYKLVLIKGLALYVLSVFITVLLTMAIAFRYSAKIRENFSKLRVFYQQISENKISKITLDVDYKEFDELGVYASRLLAEKNVQHQMLQINERRLESVLRMNKFDYNKFSELCEFTLLNILNITNSSHGYVCCLDRNKSNIKILATINSDGKSYAINSLNYSIQDDSLPARILRQGNSIIDNHSETRLEKNVFPLEINIFRHFGITFQGGEDLTIIAGACNSRISYTEEDVRQAKLLFREMWNYHSRNISDNKMGVLQTMLREGFNSMPHILIILNKEQDVVLCNENAIVSGKNPEAILKTKHYTDSWPVLKNFRHEVRGALLGNQKVTKENYLTESSAGCSYSTIIFSPIVSSDFNGVLITIEDVSEKVKVNDMMVQSEKLVSIAGISAGMAYEINKPIHKMQTDIKIIANKFSLEHSKNQKIASACGVDMKTINRYVEESGISNIINNLRASVETSDKLVSNMLRFSKQKNIKDANHSYEDINDLIDSAIDLVLNDMEIKKRVDLSSIIIRKKYDTNLPLILCDGTNIQQVVFNIIANAFYELNNIKKKGEKILSVLISKRDSWLVIEIEDNGPGMDKKTVEHIFEPFYSTKSKGDGNGLGLSISQFIIKEQHHGEINVYSELGVNTIFSIKLPLKIG